MDLDPARCYRALSARDARFDGRFFVGVRTTGIYCRPICPARTPLRRNVDFYASAAAAREAGLRPCRRCRPEASPGTAAWQGTSATIARALRLVGDGALDDADVETLAARLGIGERHLRRLFREHLGASPVAVAQTRRLHFAKKLIDETALPMTEVALAAGYQSVRRFNTSIREAYGLSPSALRSAAPRPRARHPARAAREHDTLSLRLTCREPIALGPLLEFLALRAIPGVENVADGLYRRSLVADDTPLWIEVDTTREPGAVWLRVPAEAAPQLSRIVALTRRVFDLDADPAAIAEALGGDTLLGPVLAASPGLRVPGAADPHELGVRAILGQQVSVAGARTLAARLVERFGNVLPAHLVDQLGSTCAPNGEDAPGVALTHTFPDPAILAEADVAAIGMPKRRAEAVRALSGALASGELDLSTACDPEQTRAALLAIPGIGAWTAEYIAMRALREPDAFPSGDLVLRRVAGGASGPLTDRALRTRAEAWRPWRAYAVIALWRAAF